MDSFLYRLSPKNGQKNVCSTLTLVSALLLFKQASQAFDLGFQFGDAALKRLAPGTSGIVHADKIAKCPACGCAADTIPSPQRLTR
jgi:hypothetical protein